jgi:hypothetical protein
MTCNYTINFKGGKHVAIKPQAMKSYATLMLCITANDNLILNIKTKQKENLCKDVILWFQKKMHGRYWAWMRI